MKKKIFALAIALAALTAWSATDGYTVVISLDGFRWDYCEGYDTPFLNSMGQQGVKAVMQPSFPSKTFPNHYTLATGLVPDHHGIIANTFLVRDTGKTFSLGDKEMRTNPKLFGGDPIWLTAKRQGVTTATIYWVGSDVPIKGDHATYWKNYLDNPRLTFPQRADEIVRLLQLPETKRPHLIMAYFEEPDHSGHTYGPIHRETRKAIESLDSLLHTLWTRLQALPDVAGHVNLIVTGDHGMAWTDGERTIPVKKYLKDKWIHSVEGDLPANIYVKRPAMADSVVNALKGVPHLRVWKKNDIPAYLHYGSNPNVGDVLVLPDVGWLYTDKEVGRGGSHGFDHTAADMQVCFRAIGPAFKTGYTKATTFRNVCIYPLLCHLLGVTPSPNDGSLTEVQDLLKER